MTNIDISPEAVEMWTATHGLSPAMRENVQALSAALTEFRAETAAAYERAAEIANLVARQACSTSDEMRGASMVECAILALIGEKK